MIAHIRQSDKKEESVPEHCRKVAIKCFDYAESIHASSIGKLMGLLHDVGKLTIAFEQYIRQESTAKRGDIDHSILLHDGSENRTEKIQRNFKTDCSYDFVASWTT